MQENVPENALIYIGTFKLRQYLHREVRPAANTLFLSVLRNCLYANGLCFSVFLFCHFSFAEKALSRCRTCFPACRKRLSCMLKGAFLRRKSRCQTVPDVKNRTADAFPACRDSVSDGLRYLFCEKTMSCFFTFIMHKYSSP